MAVPDKSQFARDFLGPRLKKLDDLEATRANSFEAVNAGCVELRKTDTRWGLLEKIGGAQVKDRAADIWLYDLGDGSAQVVDVVSDAEGFDGNPRPSWGLKDIRSMSQWKEPYAVVVPPPVTEQPPAAATLDTVAYLLSEIRASSKQQEALLTQILNMAKGING